MFKEIEDLSESLVLIVEDSMLTQKVISCFLEGICSVHMVTSGEKAIEFCHATPPDLILMDWVLEGMSGVEACKQLQEMEGLSDIPIIFVTSNISEQQQDLCWDAGAVDFIPKPIVAKTLINRVKTHLKYKQQADTLKRYSYYDGLTKVFNRRFFDMEGARQFKQSVRQQHTCSVVMLDIDHFKKFNDRYGHLSGDDALKAVASAIDGQIRRPMDGVYRYGGEEFAILLPDTEPGGAKQLADQFVDAVKALAIVHEDSEFGVVTISAGVASNNRGEHYQDLAQLISAADEALYNAKHQGRNQACVAEKKGA